MNLIVDIGNTRVKYALMDEAECLEEYASDDFEIEVVIRFLRGRTIDHAIVCSTRGRQHRVAECLQNHVRRVVEFLPQTPVPIQNDYRTPETLGRDRLAAAVGVRTLFPDRNVLIVDFGTAITIDLVTKDNHFRGGVISPGVAMRFRALHDYTTSLPHCQARGVDSLLGLSTEDAIVNGVMNSIKFEIEGYVDRMSEEFDQLSVIFIGGDANFFAKRIKNTIFAKCNPIFIGLDRILKYNVREKELD